MRNVPLNPPPPHGGGYRFLKCSCEHDGDRLLARWRIRRWRCRGVCRCIRRSCRGRGGSCGSVCRSSCRSCCRGRCRRGTSATAVATTRSAAISTAAVPSATISSSTSVTTATAPEAALSRLRRHLRLLLVKCQLRGSEHGRQRGLGGLGLAGKHRHRVGVPHQAGWIGRPRLHLIKSVERLLFL